MTAAKVYKGSIANALSLIPNTARPYDSTITYRFYSDVTQTNQAGELIPYPQVGSGPSAHPDPANPKYGDTGIFQFLSQADQSIVLGGMANIAKFANVTFSEAASGASADIGFAGLNYTSHQNQAAWADQGQVSGRSGNAWFTTTSLAGYSNSAFLGTSSTDYAYFAQIHELGHLLGLQHAFAAGEPTVTLPGWSTDENTTRFSVMSYTASKDANRPTFEYQLYDIAALQRLYGRDDSFNNGDNTYGFNSFFESNPGDRTAIVGGSPTSTENRYFSIWDGGGKDTIDASGPAFAVPLVSAAYIDLRPGHFSSIGPQTQVDVRAGAVADRGVANVSIAFGAVIENATGTDFADAIIGNVYGNTISGGKGDDVIYGSGSAIDGVRSRYADFGIAQATGGLDDDDGDYDKITKGGQVSGNAPNELTELDNIHGGEGDDLLVSGKGKSEIYGDEGADTLVGGGGADTLDGGAGDDKLWGDAGDDILKGGAGVDTASYQAAHSQYKVSQATSGGFTISQSGTASRDGTDTLTEVEQVRFADSKGDLIHFGVSAAITSVTEGETLSLKVSATRADGSGVSEDTWVYLKPEGSAEMADFEAQNASPPPRANPTAAASAALAQDGGFWVRIPAGKDSADLKLLAKVDKKETTETARFNVAAYVQMVNDEDRGMILDSPVNFDFGVVNQNAPSVDVKNKDTNLSLDQSGGYEGFSRAVDVAANTDVTFWFDAVDIPDYMKIWDPKTGVVYVDTDFMSGTTGASFTTAADGSGRLMITIMTNDPGTAWNLAVNAGDPTSEEPTFLGGPATRIARMSFRTTATAGDQNTSISDIDLAFGETVVSAGMRWSEVEEKSSGGGNRVFLSRGGDLADGLTIGWRIEAEGLEGVDGGDFGGSLPTGIVAFDAGVGTAQFSFAAIANDGDTMPEGFKIVFFDPATGSPVSGLNDGVAALTGRIVSPSDVLLRGTDGVDQLTGSDIGSIVLAGAGNDIINGGAGDDWIDGAAGDDQLNGGAGSDHLMGGDGSDTYVFSSANGTFSQDRIEDYGATSDVDTLNLGDFGGIAPFLLAEGNDVLITNPLTLQTIRIANQLDGDGVEVVTFISRGESVSWTREDLAAAAGVNVYHYGDGDLDIDAAYLNTGARLVLGSDVPSASLTFSRQFSDPETLVIGVADGSTIQIRRLFSNATAGGFAGVTVPSGETLSPSSLERLAVLRGSDYSDVFTSSDRNDRIAGGLGDDLLSGAGGSDVYEYNLGDGDDTIFDSRGPNADENTLRLIGISPSDVTGIRVGRSIMLSMPDGGSILLDKQLGLELPGRLSGDPTAAGVSSIVFDDGTIWDADAIKAAIGFVAPRPSPVGTDGNDTLIGDYWLDDILGGAGDDRIDGGEEDDKLYGEAGSDTLIGGEGNDYLDGGAGDNVLLGGGGADQLVDGAGADIFDGGDGNDTIMAGSADGVTDTIDGGLGWDTLDYSNSTSPVTIDLANGTVTSIETGSDSFAHVEAIVGSANADTVILDGASIVVRGGAGADTYVFKGSGGGETQLVEDTFTGDINSLDLRGLNPEDVVFSSTASGFGGSGLQIQVKATGAIIDVPDDFLNQDADGNRIFGIGRVIFGDGTVWNALDLAKAAWIRGTDGIDYLNGSYANETIDAGRGDDSITFGEGDDRVVHRSGDGNDTLRSYYPTSGSVSTLDMIDLQRADVELERAGNDLRIVVSSTGEQINVAYQFGGYGISAMRFADGQTLTASDIEAQAVVAPVMGTDGDEYLYGTDAGERIEGRRGNDALYGGNGDDTYTYRKGDGSDYIADFGIDVADTLEFVDLNEGDLRFNKSGQDMLITVVPTGEVITPSYFNNEPYSIDRIRFGDGTSLNRQQIINSAGKIVGTLGDDVLVGTAGNDSFFGLEGADVLQSGSGYDVYTGGKGDDIIRSGVDGDTYVWAKGDGNDRIEDFTTYGAFDTLRLTDVTSSDINLVRDSNNDMLIRIMPTGEVITVSGQFVIADDRGYGVDVIEFANGEYFWRDEINSSSVNAALGGARTATTSSSAASASQEEDQSVIAGRKPARLAFGYDAIEAGNQGWRGRSAFRRFNGDDSEGSPKPGGHRNAEVRAAAAQFVEATAIFDASYGSAVVEFLHNKESQALISQFSLDSRHRAGSEPTFS